MSTITLNNITSGYNVNKINDNFTTILNSINTDLVHVAGGQNVMGQDLDLNSHSLLNVSEIDASTILINGSPITTSEFILGNNVVGQANMQVGYDASLTKVADLASTTAGKGSSLVGFQQAGTGAIGRTSQDKMREVVSVKDFGAKGDGVTNDAPAITLAIQYVNSVGGYVRLEFPCGKYVVSSTLPAITVSNVVLSGNGSTLMISNGPAVFTFNGAGQLTNLYVRDFNFVATTSQVTGWAIKFLTVQFTYVEGCRFVYMSEGVDLGNNQDSFVNNSYFDNCTIGINLPGNSGCNIRNCQFGQSQSGSPYITGTYGVRCLSGGFVMSDCDVNRHQYGVAVIPPAGLSAQYMFLTNVSLDTCQYGLYGDGTLGTVSHIFATNSWFSSCNATGVFLTSVGNARFVGCQLMLNGVQGITAQNSFEISIRDSFIAWNNTTATANVAGIYLNTVTGGYLQNNQIYNGGSAWYQAVIYNQGLGIYLNGGSNIVVTGNSFVAHATDDVFINGTVTNLVIKNNVTDFSNIYASATTISPRIVHDVVRLTGTTTVANIGTLRQNGKEITFIVSGACSITSTFNFKLAGGVTFAGTPESMLTVVANGTLFIEKGRSIQ